MANDQQHMEFLLLVNDGMISMVNEDNVEWYCNRVSKKQKVTPKHANQLFE